MKVFISYGHDCVDFVTKVAHELNRLGHEVWMDYEKLYSGVEWREAIAKGIVESRAALLFHSAHSLRKGGVCRDEINIAVACNRRILRSILMEKGIVDAIPPILNGKQYYDFSDWREWVNDDVIFLQKIATLIDDVLSMQDDAFDDQMEALAVALRPNLRKNRLLYMLGKPYSARRWLRDRIDRWIEDAQCAPLLFVGFPGSGKSAFCANYSQWSPYVISCEFCEWRKIKRYDFKRIVCTVAYQAAEKLPAYRARLLWVLHTNTISIEALSLEDLFEALIIEPFMYVIDGQHPPVLIVLDGVDEVTVDGENVIAALIAQYRNRFPRFVHFLLSTRRDAAVLRYYQGEKALELSPTDDLVRQDVRAFLTECIDRGIDGAVGGDALWDKLSDLCEGSYLLANLLVDGVKSGGICLSGDVTLPQNIYSIYFQWMSRLVSAEEYAQKYAAAFSLLVATVDSITLDVFRSALGWSKGMDAMFIKRFKSFLIEDVGVDGTKKVQLFHRSFGEWLANDDFVADVYYVDPSEGRRLLSDTVYALYLQDKLSTEDMLRLWKSVARDEDDKYRQLLLADDGYYAKLLQIARDNINSTADYHVAMDALRQCAATCRKRGDAFADTYLTVHIPFVKAVGFFCAGDYIGVVQVLKDNLPFLKQKASTEDWMECLYMMGTSCDMVGAREESLSYFDQLLAVAQEEESDFYKTRSLVGLIWNSHFSDMDKLRVTLEELQDKAAGSEAEQTMLRLVSARALLSQGDLQTAFARFVSVIESPNHDIWGFDHLAIRNQMLLIETLVACYDNEEYEMGAKYGMQIYNRLKGSDSIAECYVTSWIATNLMSDGRLDEADRYLCRAEEINRLANGATSSRWIDMHLTSIRAFWYEEKGEYLRAIEGHGKVMRQAVACADPWVLGDACFELLLLARYFPVDREIYQEAHLHLAQSAEQSKLPHLVFKSQLIDAYETQSASHETWDTIKEVLLHGVMPSTDMVVCEGIGFEIARSMGRDADCEALRMRIKEEIDLILQKNQDTLYANRHKIKQIIEEISK